MLDLGPKHPVGKTALCPPPRNKSAGAKHNKPQTDKSANDSLGVDQSKLSSLYRT